MIDRLQHSLIPLGQLCDENYQVMLDKNNLHDFNNENLILQGNGIHSVNGSW